MLSMILFNEVKWRDFQWKPANQYEGSNYPNLFPREFFSLILCLAQNPSKLFQDWRHVYVQGE